MKDWIAAARGRIVPHESAAVPLADAGFVLGTTLSEQLRTFRHALFAWDEHVARLKAGAAELGLADRVSWEQLERLVREVVAANLRCTPPEADLGVSVLITPGEYAAFAGPGVASGPQIYVHTYPLAYARWAHQYVDGTVLRTAPVRQVPGESWPSSLKCRSRMHYYRADRWAAVSAPGARAVLLHADGSLSETSTANILLVYRRGEIVVPGPNHALSGITAEHTLRLAEGLGRTVVRRRVALADILRADEVWLSSTPFVLLPVVRWDDRPLPGGAGRDYATLLRAWNVSVGLDIAEQARRAVARNSHP